MSIKKEYLYMTETAPGKAQAIERLVQIVALLRSECPWDKVQTHQTLRQGMIEEAYEVIEAINNQDEANLREELGDVLLQVVFHAQLAEEASKFDLTDVINEECEKMIRRHPHVFLEETQNNDAKTIDKVLEKWENIKVIEKQEKSYASRLERVPKALPALTRAYKVQKKAADAGFDWDDVSDAFAKITEERAELLALCEEQAPEKHRLEEEMGDLLFSCVNVARFLDINPESALGYTIEKFTRRFRFIEESAEKLDKRLEDMSLEEMDDLWEEAKRQE